MLYIVVGFKLEEKIAISMGYPIILSGCIEETLILKLEEAILNGATSFLSFGVAGGLTHDLKSGDIIIGTWVIDNNTKIYCDTQFMNKFKKIQDNKFNIIFGGIKGVTHLLDKNEKFNQSDNITCAVDMESAIMARIANKHNLSFSIIRAISDPINTELPHAALVAINKDGTINYKAIMISLFKDITQIIKLIKLSISSKKAFNNLRLITKYI